MDRAQGATILGSLKNNVVFLGEMATSLRPLISEPKYSRVGHLAAGGFT